MYWLASAGVKRPGSRMVQSSCGVRLSAWLASTTMEGGGQAAVEERDWRHHEAVRDEGPGDLVQFWICRGDHYRFDVIQQSPSHDDP